MSENIPNFVAAAKDHCILNIEATDSAFVLGDAFVASAHTLFTLFTIWKITKFLPFRLALTIKKKI